MENASKALLMAGGILIALLTISVLVFAFNRMSATQRVSNQDTAEQTTIEFNNQFSTYNNDRVRGNDLLSCLNKAMDYNRRYTEEASLDYGSSETNRWQGSEYTAIKFDVILEQADREALLYDKSKCTNQIFDNSTNKTSNHYILDIDPNSKKNINEFERLIGKLKFNDTTRTYKFQGGDIQTLENDYSVQMLSNLVININLFDGPSTINNDEEKRKNENLDKIVKIEQLISEDILKQNYPSYYASSSHFRDYEFYRNNPSVVENFLRFIAEHPEKKLYKDISKYYEYIHFKRAIFECTQCDYDKNTGRIKYMKFEFTGKFN